MATKNVIEGSNKVSASQLKDFFRQIDEGGITGDHVQALLERKNPFSDNLEVRSNIKFTSWKTINIGTYKSTYDLREMLIKSHFKIDQLVESVITTPLFTITDTEREIQLVNISSEELGYKGGCKYEYLYKKAEKLGLKICPAEVGPQLRLQYTNQPKGEYLYIAMIPIEDRREHWGSITNNGSRIFEIKHDKHGLGLGYSEIDWESFVTSSQQRFIFCLPNN